MVFIVRADGRVYGGDTYGWYTTNGNKLYYKLQMTNESQMTY